MTIFFPENLYFTKNIPSSLNFLLETPLFSQFVLCHAPNNTTTRNIVGTDAWAVPPPQSLGRSSTQSPLSLRPWPKHKNMDGGGSYVRARLIFFILLFNYKANIFLQLI